MKLWKRIAVMAFAVLGLAGLAAAVVEVAGADIALSIRQLVSYQEGGIRFEMLIVFLAVAIVLAAYCVLVFMIALRAGRVRKARLLSLRDAGGDSVLLSQDTLDALVMMAIGTPDGVSDVKITTGYADREASVMIDIAVASNINIPETTKAMQERVRAQLSDVSGICVSGVDVTISNIKVPEAGEPIVPVETVLEEVVENGEIIPEEEESGAEESAATNEPDAGSAVSGETVAEEAEEIPVDEEAPAKEQTADEALEEETSEAEPAPAEIVIPEAEIPEETPEYGEENAPTTENTQE